MKISDNFFVSDCEHFLSNAEMQLMDVGNKMALTVAETESNVCNRMATIFLPLLMEKYQTQMSNKIDFANFLYEWISILTDMNKSSFDFFASNLRIEFSILYL